ncbi:hypothetical protein MUN82_18360 [Hymenobacter aerilatus]|uniref:Periplasmic heavy metal sensor n=1 Tax=Hymenobacter aerilatus TaxID=2932251 RepID=A0A8T9SU63_9BACT|nr:hypothetical protein [Hymenobacter aerilatus]UOR04891.1 hypothetical protein MUN82_18360 [Hymenobacter aerilatus]
MSVSRIFLSLALLSSLTFSCARRNKAKTAAVVEAAPTSAAPATSTGVSVARARDLTDVMTEELKLRPDQQVRVRAILSSTVEQVKDAQQKNTNNRTALLTELKRINTSSESQLKAALTPEQFRQYQLKKRSMQEQMRARQAQ